MAVVAWRPHPCNMSCPSVEPYAAIRAKVWGEPYKSPSKGTLFRRRGSRIATLMLANSLRRALGSTEQKDKTAPRAA
jgi:hypothetical protein